MDKTSQTVKLTPDPVVEEVQRRIQPLPAEEFQPRRESLIEAAMDAALRDISRREELWEGRGEKTVERRPERKPDIRPEGNREIGIETEAESKHAEKDVRRIGIPLEAQRITRPSEAAEQCERLRAHLCTHYPGDAMKVILFVGIASGSGVSTAAANFAASLAQDADAKVLLMDANFRSTKRRNADAGEREALGGIDLAQLLAHPSAVCPLPGPSNLYVLPRGKTASVPLSLFQSEGFDQLLQKLRQDFRYVVVDGPALQGYPESLVLSRKVDGVILVIESETTRKRAALWAKEQIEGAGGKLLGAVLNKRKYYIPDWLYKHI